MGLKYYIVTGDKYVIQLASNRTTTLIMKKGVGEVEEYDNDLVIEKYEMTPYSIYRFKRIVWKIRLDNISGSSRNRKKQV